jgi:uncharacterized membrane protein YoaK (UPF0700 family)
MAQVERLRVIAFVLLTLGSGATDAIAFLGLGGTFTANMTGNLVLIGLIGRADYPGTAIRATVACVAFAGALYLGFRITSVRLLLWIEFALQAVFLVVWWLAGASLSPGQMIGLIVLSSLAMGVQTAAVRQLKSTSGITTTFVTGTLTSLMEGEARGKRGGNASRVAVVLALVMGALLGAIALKVVPKVAPTLAPLAVLGAGFLLGERHTLAR